MISKLLMTYSQNLKAKNLSTFKLFKFEYQIKVVSYNIQPFEWLVNRKQVKYIFGSMSVPIVVLGNSQMSRLRQAMRQMFVYLTTTSYGIITFYRTSV